MQNISSTILLSMVSFGLFAQTTLTSRNNALIIGESCTYSEINFIDPGYTGENQIWDYTHLEYTGKTPLTSFETSDKYIEGIRNSNLGIADDGYTYLMNSNNNSLEELGYSNEEKKMNMVYSDPVLKMKYPFSFGNQFTDEFAGVALFNENYKIEFTGTNTVTADAYGTLLLPNLILENAMRVKSVKKGIQINPCGQVKVNIVKYAWYAEGYRYPVLIISIVENTYTNSTEIIKTASVYLPEINNTSNNFIPKNSGNSVKSSVNNGVSVTLFPNPFSEKITYNYFLKKDVPVSIMLYDITGKYTEKVVDNQLQTSGFHSGEIGGLKSTLPAGVYYVRLIFGEQVVVQKFVKLEAQ